jgi:hypothetical protein
MARTMLVIQFQTDQLTGEKRINIRGNITGGDLITAIQRQFSLDGLYELKMGGRLLDPALPLDEQGVTDGLQLVFSATEIKRSESAALIAQGARHDFSVQKQRVFMRDDREATEYDLTWQPSVIGRRDPRDPARNRLLAVDLEETADAMSVSRHHACITEEGGVFYIESLSERNPTYVNDAPLRFGIRSVLRAGDRLLAGKTSLTFYIID